MHFFFSLGLLEDGALIVVIKYKINTSHFLGNF